MKKISRFVMALLLGATVTTSFTACSDSNDEGSELDNPTITNKWTGDQSTMWEIANTYVNDVVYPTYTDLANNAKTLYEKALVIQTKYNAGNLTDDDIKNACIAFEDARREWERSEAFLFGAASDYNIDPHMDSWPLDQGQVADFLSDPSMVAGLKSDDPIKFVRDNNSTFDTALGFHGVEYVLFRNKAYRVAADFAAGKKDVFVGADGSRKEFDCANEIPFLVAVCGDLRDHCYWLEVAWKGLAASDEAKNRVAELGFKTHAKQNSGYFFGADMLLAGQDNITQYNSIEAALATIIGDSGCGNICNEVQEQKLGQAWRVENGQGGTTEDGEKESADYIESPYSGRSFIDYRDNLYSIKNSLYGNRLADKAGEPEAKSILTYLKSANYEGYNDLVNALNDAIKSLSDPIAKGEHFVDNPGSDTVKNAIDKIAKLYDELIKAKSWVEKR